MLTDAKTLRKLAAIEKRYHDLRFQKVAEITMELHETREHHRAEPQNVDWCPVKEGDGWGGNWMTGWFRGELTIPRELAGKKLFLNPVLGVDSPPTSSPQVLFILDGEYRGVFDENHPQVMLAKEARAGRKHRVVLEAYANHSFPGCQPDELEGKVEKQKRLYGGVWVTVEREDVTAFVFDLRTLLQLVKVLDDNSLRKNQVARELARVFTTVYAKPLEVAEAEWRAKLAEAREIMRPLLESKNGPTAPFIGIVGHSHIDTAWLWPIAETWRKCARTFSSIINLLDQYPEFIFTQSAPYHAAIIKEKYPSLFEAMRRRVKEGRWEPNGAMWVEPDCNIPSGESLVRQLLHGQRATREWFGYTADAFWQPDVFGYSAALPQILKQACVDFFYTTKIAWNDTTRFPYDTFHWQGIDGTTVLAHYNTIHCWPDPETMVAQWNWVQHKDVQDRRLLAYGFGDGGGGPMAEMIEASRRVGDLEGCPRSRHVTISDFMKGVRDDLSDRLPRWVGELYLELHRGTLTSIAKIKRGNRKMEASLHDVEFLHTLSLLQGGEYPAEKLDALWKKFLVNQFHDILPGSSIAEVNDQAMAEFDSMLAEAAALKDDALAAVAGKQGRKLVLFNTLSWPRTGTIHVAGLPDGTSVAGKDITAQTISSIDGGACLALSGVEIPAYGAVTVDLVDAPKAKPENPFRYTRKGVETPLLTAKFDDAGRIVSCIIKETGREIVRCGGALNTLLLGEDVPEAWDNWDIDADQGSRMVPITELLSRSTVHAGPLELRILSEYKIGAHSRLRQVMVFHADSLRIDFESVIDWSEKYRHLKAGFELEVNTDYARHEIQFGHVERPTHRNLPQDRARFEVAHQKWMDLSENNFGVALLNDCKYGVNVLGSEVRLSLMKSGRHPDPRGDEGRHYFTYSLLPHEGPFSVESVVRPAFELNSPVVAVAAAKKLELESLVTIDNPSVIIDTVKKAEDGNAVVVRLYEAGRCSGNAHVAFGRKVRAVSEINLLEETQKRLKVEDNGVDLHFRPFQLRSLLVQFV